jgi:hypothetical protein
LFPTGDKEEGSQNLSPGGKKICFLPIFIPPYLTELSSKIPRDFEEWMQIPSLSVTMERFKLTALM